MGRGAPDSLEACLSSMRYRAKFDRSRLYGTSVRMEIRVKNWTLSSGLSRLFKIIGQ